MEEETDKLRIQTDIDQSLLQLIRSDTTMIQFQITDDIVIRTVYFDWKPNGIVSKFPIKCLRQDQLDWIQHLIKTKEMNHDDSD